MRSQAALLAALASAWAATASVTSLPSSFVNSLGMNMTLILPGSFVQGWSVTPLPANLTLGMANRQFGDADESPYQRTTINAPFYMGAWGLVRSPGGRARRTGARCGRDESLGR